ncbi:hypothetical protein [Staphylococcus felis]|uniref:hypothetical protein n=1 Tax=Staphylococcus felis TaxID=46127 RepID=UPI0021D14240|nr:hypothetical protein [Staphylococcus felis]UXR86423.1 hypothetical protein MUA17_10295 [Staphylococcus felis]
MIILYLVLFVLVMWIGQYVGERLEQNVQKSVILIWLSLIFIIEGLLIYQLMKFFITAVVSILKLFYHE